MIQADEKNAASAYSAIRERVEPWPDDLPAVLPDAGERWPLELSAFCPTRLPIVVENADRLGQRGSHVTRRLVPFVDCSAANA